MTLKCLLRLVCLSSLALSEASAMDLIVFGDSNSVGHGLTAPALPYTDQLATALSLPLTNYAALADQAGDQAFKAYGYAVDANNVHIIAVGTNDAWKYGADTAKRGYFAASLRALILSAALSSRVNVRTGGTFTGSWVDTVVNSIGKNTMTAGAKVSATVSGSSIYIGTILQSASTAGGTATVRVDGTVVGSINAIATGIDTANGLAYPPGVFRFVGLTSGSHLVEIEVTSNSKYFYVDYIAGNEQPSAPPTFVANVPQMAAAGYAYVGGSDANTAAYNTILAAVVSDLAADGLAVNLVDVHSAIDPATDLQSDGIHLNVSGHADYKAEFLTAIGLPPQLTYTEVSVYRRSDGTFFAGDGAERRELLTAQ